jgi:hypothetical protein
LQESVSQGGKHDLEAAVKLCAELRFEDGLQTRGKVPMDLE